jgi:hypothetical protein
VANRWPMWMPGKGETTLSTAFVRTNREDVAAGIDPRVTAKRVGE